MSSGGRQRIPIRKKRCSNSLLFYGSVKAKKRLRLKGAFKTEAFLLDLKHNENVRQNNDKITSEKRG